jgi:hypothetical protein
MTIYVCANEIEMCDDCGRDCPIKRVSKIELINALIGLKKGDCFCDVGIDNPMLQGRHSRSCGQATRALDKLKE